MFSNFSLFPETRFVAPQHWTSPDRPRKTKTVHRTCFSVKFMKSACEGEDQLNATLNQIIVHESKRSCLVARKIELTDPILLYKTAKKCLAIGKCLSTEIPGIQHFSRPGSRHKYPYEDPCSIVCCTPCHSRHFSCMDKADIEWCLRSTFRVKIKITT